MEVFLESTEHLRPDSILEIQLEPMEEFSLGIQLEPMEEFSLGNILELTTEVTEELSLGLMQEQRVRRGTELLPRWAHPRRLHGERRALVRLRRHGLHLRVRCPL